MEATYLNETSIVCESPPNPYISSLGFEDNYVEVTLTLTLTPILTLALTLTLGGADPHPHPNFR